MKVNWKTTLLGSIAAALGVLGMWFPQYGHIFQTTGTIMAGSGLLVAKDSDK